MSETCTHKNVNYLSTSIVSRPSGSFFETLAECLDCRRQFSIPGGRVSEEVIDAIEAGQGGGFSMGTKVGFSK